MNPNSSNSAGGGNTKTPPTSQKTAEEIAEKKKQISPAKRWCFTVNNYDFEMVKEISSIVPELCDVYIVAKEVGKKGTPHLQGYVEFKEKCRPRNIFKNNINKFHWEKAKGNRNANFVYCNKDGNLLMAAGHKLRRPVKILTYDQLRKWQTEIIDIINQEPDDRTIYWYWSKKGNVGKTTFCKYLTMKHEALPLAGKGADVRNGIVEYVKTYNDTPELVVFPIPRSYNSEYLSYEALENIKDMYFYSGKYEGKPICGNPPHLIVFSNHPPDTSRMSVDRWKIMEIKENEAEETIMDVVESDDDND